jgi:hypothetical protein
MKRKSKRIRKKGIRILFVIVDLELNPAGDRNQGSFGGESLDLPAVFFT